MDRVLFFCIRQIETEVINVEIERIIVLIGLLAGASTELMNLRIAIINFQTAKIKAKQIQKNNKKDTTPKRVAS